MGRQIDHVTGAPGPVVAGREAGADADRMAHEAPPVLGGAPLEHGGNSHARFLSSRCGGRNVRPKWVNDRYHRPISRSFPQGRRAAWSRDADPMTRRRARDYADPRAASCNSEGLRVGAGHSRPAATAGVRDLEIGAWHRLQRNGPPRQVGIGRSPSAASTAAAASSRVESRIGSGETSAVTSNGISVQTRAAAVAAALGEPGDDRQIDLPQFLPHLAEAELVEDRSGGSRRGRPVR